MLQVDRCLLAKPGNAAVSPATKPGSAGSQPASGPGSAGIQPASGPGSAGIQPASGLLSAVASFWSSPLSFPFLVGLSMLTIPSALASEAVTVEHRGSMADMFKDSAKEKISLSELKSKKHLYALGPLSGLRGEILIWDGVPFETRVNGGTVQTKKSWDEGAAFLAWSSVEKWQKVRVPAAVVNMATLQQWLGSMSGKPGQAAQYPFLLKGNFANIKWHIVNFPKDSTDITPETHKARKVFDQTGKCSAEVLGVFSPSMQGIFIPMGSTIHMHVKQAEKMVAHLDEFSPAGDYSLTLYLPSSNKDHSEHWD